MANALGYVTETKAGFEGTLAMMNLSAAIRIEKNAEKSRRRPAGLPHLRRRDLDRDRRRLDAQSEAIGPRIPLDHARRPPNRPPQDLREPRAGQRQEGPSCDPLEPEGITIFFSQSRAAPENPSGAAYAF